jgi:hypothetical protein
MLSRRGISILMFTSGKFRSAYGSNAPGVVICSFGLHQTRTKDGCA